MVPRGLWGLSRVLQIAVKGLNGEQRRPKVTNTEQIFGGVLLGLLCSDSDASRLDKRTRDTADTWEAIRGLGG